METTRRDFLRHVLSTCTVLSGAVGMSAATEASGEAPAFLLKSDFPDEEPADPPIWQATEDNILGPYFRKHAPYRAKISPPLSAGEVVLIFGQVFALDTRQPLGGAVIDIWHADHNGRYDNSDPARPPAPDLFLYRARLVTDERGFYEYETILPGNYRTAPDTWRPRHMHYSIAAKGYRPLVTQLYFSGERYNDVDAFIKPSLIIDLQPQEAPGGTYKRGKFDVIMAAK